MSTIQSTLQHISQFMQHWWSGNRETILGSMETHKLVWIFGTGFVSFISLFVLGGALIKNGIIFGLLLTSAIVLLFSHKSKDGGKAKKKLLGFLAKHTAICDITLTLICIASFATSGVTAGMSVIVTGIFISMLLHYVEEQYKLPKEIS